MRRILILGVVFLTATCNTPDRRTVAPIDYDTARTMGALMEPGPPSLVDAIRARSERAESPEVAESISVTSTWTGTFAQFQQRGAWACGFWSNTDYTWFQKPDWLDSNAKYVDHCIISSVGDPKAHTWLVLALEPLATFIQLPGKYGCQLWLDPELALNLADPGLWANGTFKSLYGGRGVQVNITPPANLIGRTFHAQLVKLDDRTDSLFTSHVYVFPIAAK